MNGIFSLGSADLVVIKSAGLIWSSCRSFARPQQQLMVYVFFEVCVYVIYSLFEPLLAIDAWKLFF